MCAHRAWFFGFVMNVSNTAKGIKIICKNRRAYRDYEIADTLEAGISLLGSEVKSCRLGRVSIQEAYAQVLGDEAYLMNARIAEYAGANQFNHDPMRKRKLLLHRKQIEKMDMQIARKSYTAIPLSMYFKQGKVKVELAIGRGRAHADQRNVVRDREVKREMERAMKRKPKRDRS